jgi:hypothetical protein
MNDLAKQKELLVLQSDLHRELLRLERLRLEKRMGATADRVRAGRWWITGGLLGAGLLFSRAGKLTRWIPVAAAAWKFLQKKRAAHGSH